ncbi:MAG: hypothetical protein RL160_245 [Bacteroidota bacterium]|jgi:hypothetical protein
MQWSVEAAAWLLIPIALLAAASTWLLYRRHPFRRENGSTPPVVWVMAVCRFLALFLVLLLLLLPVFRLRKNEVVQPLLLVFTDHSRSLGVLPDSARIMQWYQGTLKDQADRVFGPNSLRLIPFGCGMEQPAKGLVQPCTDLERTLREAADRYAGQHIGAVVVLSDGIASSGINPSYLNNPFKAPLYTIGLGDTVRKKDLAIKKAEAPRVVFMGNEFTVEADIAAQGYAGASLEVQLLEEGRVLARQTVQAIGNPPYAQVRFQVPAREPGMKRFQVQVMPQAGEWSLRNNGISVLTEVVDERQKIAVVFGSPHPDVGALKEVLESAPAFEVQAFDLAAFNTKAAADYDLIIWHQVPGILADAGVQHERAVRAGVNMLYILGPGSKLDAFARLEPGLRITAPGNKSTEAQGAWNASFSGFAPEPAWEGALSSLPPMQVPFGSYPSGPGLEVLVWQKIGSVLTSNPLIAFRSDLARKTGFISGDGLWRWRMHFFAQKKQHDDFDRFLLRIIRYAAVRGNRSRFRVEPTKQLFRTDEYAVFEGVVLDQTMTPVPGKSIEVDFEGPAGFRKRMTMSPSGSTYRLEAGGFPPGAYRYSARLDGQKATGAFLIQEEEGELQLLQADWKALRSLAVNNGGAFAPNTAADDLFRLIADRNKIQPLLRSEISNTDALDAWWYMTAILLLLSAEWLLRRVFGSY